jgi:hypothetical protein
MLTGRTRCEASVYLNGTAGCSPWRIRDQDTPAAAIRCKQSVPAYCAVRASAGEKPTLGGSAPGGNGQQQQQQQECSVVHAEAGARKRTKTPTTFLSR